MNRWVPALGLFPHRYSPQLSFICSVSQRLAPAGCISKAHLPAGLGLVSAKRKETPLEDGGSGEKPGHFSPFLLPDTPASPLCLLLSSHWTGHHYPPLSSNKPSSLSRLPTVANLWVVPREFALDFCIAIRKHS